MKEVNERLFDLHIRGCDIDGRDGSQEKCKHATDDFKFSITSSYLHQLEEEVKRLGKIVKLLPREDKKHFIDFNDRLFARGFNKCRDISIPVLQKHITEIEEAIKEIKALQ